MQEMPPSARSAHASPGATGEVYDGEILGNKSRREMSGKMPVRLYAQGLYASANETWEGREQMRQGVARGWNSSVSHGKRLAGPYIFAQDNEQP